MYIDFAAAREVRLIVKTTTRTYPRRWAIELVYVECDNPSIGDIVHSSCIFMLFLHNSVMTARREKAHTHTHTLNIVGHTSYPINHLTHHLSTQTAPTGCVQYFTGTSGTVSTFNAACAPPLTTSVARVRRHNLPRVPPVVVQKVNHKDCLLGGHDYSICVRSESDMVSG